MIDPDTYVESDFIADRFIHPGVSLSIYNLLEVMLTESDNTATDALVRTVGGPAVVTDWVRRQGVADLRVDRDPRDTATPEAMAALLARIFEGHALSPASTATLTAIMDRCNTGKDRLRGLLPADTHVAHKTGTLGGSANDVGVMTLADGRRIVVAVFIRASAAPLAKRERVIAEIGRSIRDYYLFSAADRGSH